MRHNEKRTEYKFGEDSLIFIVTKLYKKIEIFINDEIK